MGYHENHSSAPLVARSTAFGGIGSTSEVDELCVDGVTEGGA